MHDDLVLFAKIIGVSIAVGLDVLAISVGIGVARLPWRASMRLGAAFATAEILMQVIGYELGSGAGRLLGDVAADAGIGLLALVGLLMLRSALHETEAPEFDPTKGAGLVMTALSVSLDSLGVGIALPNVAIPLLPMVVVLSISTTLFTFLGLSFGARLGTHFEARAELLAACLLLLLAAAFAIERYV
jgi:putative Mn2+ efflux pump MntP